jgi:hypothetical protein
MPKATLSSRKFRPRVLAIAASVIPVVAAGLLTAPSAHADQVWYQSVGRASAASTCQESTAADLAAGWTKWLGTWERWMNAGAGGYTCARSLVWAKDSAPSQVGPAGCAQMYVPPTGMSVNFASSNYLPRFSAVYNEGTCATVASMTNIGLVYATSQVQAQALCMANENLDASQNLAMNPNIYACVI